MTEAVFTPVLPAADLSQDGVRAITVAGRSILLIRDEGELFAIENLCSHADEPLACGRVKRGWIACPAHGARFDLATGEPLGPPATVPIATFPVRIAGDAIEVTV